MSQSNTAAPLSSRSCYGLSGGRMSPKPGVVNNAAQVCCGIQLKRSREGVVIAGELFVRQESGGRSQAAGEVHDWLVRSIAAQRRPTAGCGYLIQRCDALAHPVPQQGFGGQEAWLAIRESPHPSSLPRGEGQ